jgi:hypothetical protein
MLNESTDHIFYLTSRDRFRAFCASSKECRRVLNSIALLQEKFIYSLS